MLLSYRINSLRHFFFDHAVGRPKYYIDLQFSFIYAYLQRGRKVNESIQYYFIDGAYSVD